MHEENRLVGKKLSKAVLELKFMKKSKEKAQLQEENEERQNLYQDQLSSLHEGADRIVMVNSYYDCMDFLPCRLSFGGMDVDVEKLNKDKLTGIYKVTKASAPEIITKMDADVTAEEMAESYHPTSRYRKRKSDHLDDYDTERKRDGSNFCDVADERTFNSNSRGKNSESVISERTSSSRYSISNFEGGQNQGKSPGKTRGTRPIFKENSRGIGEFRNKDRGRGNFMDKGRGGRGRGSRGRGSRGRGNFRDKYRGSNSGSSNFQGNDRERNSLQGINQSSKQSKGNFRESTQEKMNLLEHDDIDNRRNFPKKNKKFKFMKPQE
ncbi:uncharacterized protein Mpp6 [Panulirus ornatus]|uniref:uncharacterized protein Mpp6 n=1 Tax=Panulirus ornatus TaxID=150431 RepID=UPI003A89148A